MTTDPLDPFLRVLRGLLRPLVRTLIARGVTLPVLYRVLKSVYVEVARDSFRLDDTPPTDSRVSLLTGVHRRDIRTILAAGDTTWDTARARSALLATVLSSWRSLPGFADEGGPRPLPRSGDDGRDFESLVRAISNDIRPRTVLDELLHQNLVTENDEGLLTPVGPSVIGPGSDDHKLIFFAENVGDHLAAASENLLKDPSPFLERAVFYNRMTSADVDRVEARARDLSQTMLEEIAGQAQPLQQATRDAEDNHVRFRMGVYFYRDGDAPDANRSDDEEDQS